MSKQNHNYSQYSNKRRDANVGESAANAVKQNYNYHQQNKPKIGTIEVDKLPNITPEIAAMGHPDPVGEPGPMGVVGIPEVKVVTTPNVVQPKPQFVQETVNTVSLPETVEGKIVNCAKLNVRENASINSDIVCILDVMSEFEVDVNRTTPTWAYIYTATGAEGYCMRQYIEAHL